MPKLVKNENHLARVFTYVKITESASITLFVYLAGLIRMKTDSFTYVSVMLLLCCIAAMISSLFLMKETQAVGSQLLNMQGNLQMLRQYASKFVQAAANGSEAVKGSPKGSSGSDSESPEKGRGESIAFSKRKILNDDESMSE